MNIKELINVSKPARYIGGELNSIIKSDNDLLEVLKNQNRLMSLMF